MPHRTQITAPDRARVRGVAWAAVFGLVAFATSAEAAIFTVGTGAGCSHGTIQSALNAANAAPGADTVRLTRSLTYEPEANTLNASENLNLVGGFATCTQSATDTIKTVVSGAGGASAPVFRIIAGTGVVIKLRHLIITLGDEDGAGYGGGILFTGDGVLEIIESNITNNTAGYGGGIFAQATGTNAELVVSEGTQISGNTARYDGGGLHISGPIEMTMVAPSSIIAFNTASGLDGFGGYGGGIQVIGPARVYIGSSGVGGLGAIYSNSAVDGGGISVISGAGDGVDALVHLFTTDPQQPIMVRGNEASDTGGAVYLQSYQGFTDESIAKLCAQDFRIEDNFARDGGAIYQNSDSFGGITYAGADVFINDPGCVRAGAVRCASGVPCNTLSANDTSTSGSAEDGAVLRLLPGARLYASRFEMRDNRAGYAIRGSSDSNALTGISDCLLTDNDVTRRMVVSIARIDGCTLARNAIGSTDVIYSEGGISLYYSIIDQPGHLTLATSGGAGILDIRYVLSNDITTLPSHPSNVAGAPLFVDAAGGNYRLLLSSPAIDFAPPIIGGPADLDLDGLQRDLDMPGIPDYYGVRDLGAYERQRGLADCGEDDTIFCNEFDLL